MTRSVWVAASAVVLLAAGCGSSANKVGQAGEPQSSVVNDGTPTTLKSVSSTSTTVKAAPTLNVVKKGFRYTVKDPKIFGYGVILLNQASDQIATGVTVNITFFSGANVAASENDTIAAIYPGQQVAVGDFVSDTPGVDRMEVQVLPGKWQAATGTLGGFTVDGVQTVTQSYLGLKTTGLIHSTFAKDLKNVDTTVLYFDAAGEITGGDSTYVDFVPAGGAIGFQATTLWTPASFASTQVFPAISSLTLLGQ